MDQEKEFPDEHPQSEVIAEEHPGAESAAAEAIAPEKEPEESEPLESESDEPPKAAAAKNPAAHASETQAGNEAAIEDARQTPPPADVVDLKKGFIVQTYSGFQNKVPKPFRSRPPASAIT